MRRLVPLLFATLLLTACPGGTTRGAAGSVSADSLHSWMRGGKPMVVLDVRPAAEFEARHLPGAIPAHGLSIPDLREVLPPDPAAPLVIYNADGSIPESGLDLADEAAETYGFPRVYRLEGGLAAWMELGFDVDGTDVGLASPLR